MFFAFWCCAVATVGICFTIPASFVVVPVSTFSVAGGDDLEGIGGGAVVGVEPATSAFGAVGVFAGSGLTLGTGGGGGAIPGALIPRSEPTEIDRCVCEGSLEIPAASRLGLSSLRGVSFR